MNANDIDFKRFFLEQNIRDAIDRDFNESWFSQARSQYVEPKPPAKALDTAKRTVVQFLADSGGDALWGIVPFGTLLSKAFQFVGGLQAANKYPIPNEPDFFASDQDLKDAELAGHRRNMVGWKSGITTKFWSGAVAAAVFLGGAWMMQQHAQTAAEKRGETRAAQQYQQKVSELENEAKRLMSVMTPEQKEQVQKLAKQIVPPIKSGGERTPDYQGTPPPLSGNKTTPPRVIHAPPIK